MYSRTYSLACFVALACVLVTPVTWAAITLNSPETWSNPASLSGWIDSGKFGDLSNPGGAAPTGSYLRISFDQHGGQPQVEDALATSTTYSGSYQTNGGYLLALSFSFYAEDILPDSSTIYLHSTNSGGVTWDLAFSNLLVNSWTTQTILFHYEAGLAGWSAGPHDFYSDLAGIDWIGVNISRALNTMAQDYGIGNWEYFTIMPHACPE